MIVVRLPATLRAHAGGADALHVTAPVTTIAELVQAIARTSPELVRQLDDAVYNFAVNDEMILHKAQEHPVRDGDRVEIVPAIAGG